MIRNNNYLHHVHITKVKFGERGSCPIDQTPAQTFNIDPHTGRPMSDIQRLVHIQNDLNLAQEFAQLKEFEASYMPKDMKDEDAIKYACPRLVQLPSEILNYRASLARQANERVIAIKSVEMQRKVVARQAEIFDEFMNKSVVNKSVKPE